MSQIKRTSSLPPPEEPPRQRLRTDGGVQNVPADIARLEAYITQIVNAIATNEGELAGLRGRVSVNPMSDDTDSGVGSSDQETDSDADMDVDDQSSEFESHVDEGEDEDQDLDI